ncbi:zinc finger family protein [Striga asiatica]|uniref:Zinc finger family protein n=1 Tax=Striga asiatica TaxID=4170 RepID=A0A5A7RI91_STRAF|nr:zinc finger family protein [Striga asiatica]
MLTCISRSKQGSCEDSPPADPSKQALKTLSSQIKDMALKASGAYRHCAPFADPAAAKDAAAAEQEAAAAEKFRRLDRRTGSSTAAGRRELEARLKGISSGEGTPASASGRRLEAVVFVEESEPREWVAQVEPGVLITFLSLPRGGNDLKRIRFRIDVTAF